MQLELGAGADVLVVEDDPEVNRLIGAYVDYAGLHYVPAFDGAQALSSASCARPRLVLLDLMLPDMSGWEICRQLKASAALFDVPVVILSALDDDRSREEGRRAGAVAYLTKPFNPDQLLEVLRRFAGAPGDLACSQVQSA